MIRVKVGCSMGLQGCRYEDVLEFEDGATPEEIEGAVSDWALEKFEYWHEVIA